MYMPECLVAMPADMRERLRADIAAKLKETYDLTEWVENDKMKSAWDAPNKLVKTGEKVKGQSLSFLLSELQSGTGGRWSGLSNISNLEDIAKFFGFTVAADAKNHRGNRATIVYSK